MFAEPTCSCPPDSTLRMEASGNGYYKTGCWKGK
jgi:hypothetical protein